MIIGRWMRLIGVVVAAVSLLCVAVFGTGWPTRGDDLAGMNVLCLGASVDLMRESRSGAKLMAPLGLGSNAEDPSRYDAVLTSTDGIKQLWPDEVELLLQCWLEGVPIIIEGSENDLAQVLPIGVGDLTPRQSDEFFVIRRGTSGPMKRVYIIGNPTGPYEVTADGETSIDTTPLASVPGSDEQPEVRSVLLDEALRSSMELLNYSPSTATPKGMGDPWSACAEREYKQIAHTPNFIVGIITFTISAYKAEEENPEKDWYLVRTRLHHFVNHVEQKNLSGWFVAQRQLHMCGAGSLYTNYDLVEYQPSGSVESGSVSRTVGGSIGATIGPSAGASYSFNWSKSTTTNYQGVTLNDQTLLGLYDFDFYQKWYENFGIPFKIVNNCVTDTYNYDILKPLMPSNCSWQSEQLSIYSTKAVDQPMCLSVYCGAEFRNIAGNPSLRHLELQHQWFWARVSSQSFIVFPEQSGGGAAADCVSQPAGWNFISLPVDPYSPLVEDVFGDYVDPIDLCYYEDGGWIGTVDSTPVAVYPLKAYWLKLSEETYLCADGTRLTGDQAAQLGQTGWQMIGVPYEIAWGNAAGGGMTVSLGSNTKSLPQAVRAGWISNVVWSYDGDWVETTLSQGTTLDPWKGYCIYTYLDDLVLGYSEDPAGEQETASFTAMPSGLRPLMDPPMPATGLPPVPLPPSTEGLTFQNAPNPIRDVHTTRFEVIGATAIYVSLIKVQVFDLSGRLVFEGQGSGASLEWDTRNTDGEYLANGTYLYKIFAKLNGQWVAGETKTLTILK